MKGDGKAVRRVQSVGERIKGQAGPWINIICVLRGGDSGW